MKFAVLSHVLPPSPSGQSVMLYRILSCIDSDDYYLITSQPQQSTSDTFQLQSQIYTLSPEPTLRFGIQRIRNTVNLFVSIFARTRSLLELLRREPARALIACTGELVDIPAAFLASRLMHIPFYAYVFDDYVYQWMGNYRRFAQMIAPLIFKRAAGIITPNEFIGEEYRQRYGIMPTLVRNPCDANELDKEPCAPWPAEIDKIKIIYTGAIYHANYDCFRNLLSAMDVLPEYSLELHIFTAQTREELLEQNIDGEKVIIHSHVSYRETLEQQRKADILFLPLAFESPISEVIRTSAPGKLGEYLASGRPILAHVPADSFVADYCGKHRCASIAYQNNPTTLAQHIKDIITNEEFRSILIRNALSQAQIDFHPQHASEKLIQLLNAK
ncbi:MAG: glycosyltransferase [Chloroflexi bacterium]|nr:glycosyltransferase [Chloroflexota bacterium]